MKHAAVLIAALLLGSAALTAGHSHGHFLEQDHHCPVCLNARVLSNADVPVTVVALAPMGFPPAVRSDVPVTVVTPVYSAPIVIHGPPLI